jgi:hypothetical protein
MKDVTVAQKKRGDYRCVNSMQYRIPYRSTGVLERTVGHGLGTSRKLTSLVSRASSRSKSLCKTGFATGIVASRVVIRFDRFIASLASIGQYQTWLPPPAANPTNGYETLRAKHHFDMMDLFILTNFQIGQSTISIMSRNPDLLATLLGCGVGSHLIFVPRRYGHKPYLTVAIDCVTTKVRNTSRPSDTDLPATATNIYGKALRAFHKSCY